MRTLKYAILGMLSRRELTGYDMMKEFDRGLANFWYASCKNRSATATKY